MLKSVASGFEIMSARDDSNRGCNPSGPSILPGLRLVINGRTVSSVTCTDSMVGIS
ncbi:unnamed protein product, partial [Schistosoma guineensis]